MKATRPSPRLIRSSVWKRMSNKKSVLKTYSSGRSLIPPSKLIKKCWMWEPLSAIFYLSLNNLISLSSIMDSITRGDTLRFLSCRTAHINLFMISTSNNYCPMYLAISVLLKASKIVGSTQTAPALLSVLNWLKQLYPKHYFNFTSTESLSGIISFTLPFFTT